MIDHYAPAWQCYTRTAPLFRAVLRRVPSEAGKRVTERLVDVFRPLHQVARSRVAAVVVNRLSPITFYDRALPQLSEDLKRQWALLDTHDSLTDWFKHRRTLEEIRQTLTTVGASEVWTQHGGNGIEARARRPTS